MSRADMEAGARAALEAAAELVDDELYSGLAKLIRALDPAAIVAGVPECLSAMEQVALDLHDALGIKWGDDPYAAISALRAENEHLRHVNMGKVSRELYEAATQELRARVAELEKDAARLAALECLVDGIGGIDIHEEAFINALAFGRDEPNRNDYLAAIRTAIDAAMKEGK